MYDSLNNLDFNNIIEDICNKKNYDVDQATELYYTLEQLIAEYFDETESEEYYQRHFEWDEGETVDIKWVTFALAEVRAYIFENYIDE